MGLECTRCIDFSIAVAERDVYPAATPERVEFADVNVPPRNEVIGRVVVTRVNVEGVGVTAIFHCEIPVSSGNRGNGVEHGNIGLNGDDTDRSFRDTIGVFLAWRSLLDEIAEG